MAETNVASKSEFKNKFKNKLYGKIPTPIMTDRKLSCEAKALYGTLICYMNMDNDVSPPVWLLIYVLHIGKEKLRKLFAELIIQGYIEKKKVEHFKKNIYTIIACPSKYENVPEPENEKDTKRYKIYKDIKKRGLQAGGYGIVPRLIMTKFNNLDIKAKAILLYFCAFADNTDTVWLEAERIQYHLRISRNTYYRYLAQLVEKNIVESITIRDNHGRFAKQAYVLVSHPNANHADKTDSQTMPN